jgi:hypothetical protein
MLKKERLKHRDWGQRLESEEHQGTDETLMAEIKSLGVLLRLKTEN